MYQLFWAFRMYTLFNIRPVKQTQYSHITNLEMIKNCNNNWSFSIIYAILCKNGLFLCEPRTSRNLFHRGNKMDYLCAFMNW